MPSRRLSTEARRETLLDSGAAQFATRAFEDVVMDEVARDAGVSRAILYRHFPSKRDLFAAIYQRAADELVASTELDPSISFVEQVEEGLDAHIDYFVANRHTVLTANRTLAGDPVIQAIISDELAVLRQRLVDASGLDGAQRDATSAIVMSWLVFVRTLSVEWLAVEPFSRAVLRDVCRGALLGAVTELAGLDRGT